MNPFISKYFTHSNRFFFLAFFLLVFGCKSEDLKIEEVSEQLPFSYMEMIQSTPEGYFEIVKFFSATAEELRLTGKGASIDMEPLSIKNTAQLIETALNYDFHYIASNPRSFHGNTFSFQIAEDSSQFIAPSDVLNSYNQIWQQVEQALSKMKNAKAELIDVVLNYKSDGGAELQFNMLIVVDEPVKGIGFDCGVRDDDFWHPGNDMGKCGTNEFAPWDAADREMDIMNNHLCEPACAGTTITFPLSLQGEPFWYNSSPIGNLHWLVFGGNQVTCLEPSDMEFNMTILEDIKNTFNPGGNYKFKSVDMHSEEYWNIDYLYTYHHGVMYYVIEFCSPSGPGGT